MWVHKQSSTVRSHRLTRSVTGAQGRGGWTHPCLMLLPKTVALPEESRSSWRSKQMQWTWSLPLTHSMICWVSHWMHHSISFSLNALPALSNCRTVWLQEATEIRDVEYIVIISKQTQVEQSLIFFHRPLGEKRAKASTRISYYTHMASLDTGPLEPHVWHGDAWL